MPIFLDVKEQVASVHILKDHVQGEWSLKGIMQFQNELVVHGKKNFSFFHRALHEHRVLDCALLDCLHRVEPIA